MKKMFLNIITFICIIAICISGYKIFTTLKDYKKADSIYSNVQEVKNSNEHNDLFNKMIAINPDYKCWITVDGTNINYPVVQGNDNSFYLNRDINKNYLPAGSIFMDYENQYNLDFNTIIYGHHMRNSTMFGQLEKFKEKDFFDSNKFITISTKDHIYKYEIFAIGVYPSDYGYNKIYFENENNINSFLKRIMDDSLFARPNVSSSDKIITLSTCSYEYDDARIALFAKLLK